MSGKSTLVVMLAILLNIQWTAAIEKSTPAPVAHWKFEGDLDDRSESSLKTRSQGVQLESEDGERPSAKFDGIDDFLEVPNSESLAFFRGDFTIVGWFNIPDKITDLSGDLVSKYDPVSGKGFQLTLQHGPGVTNAESNKRNLTYGISSGAEGFDWKDAGRPGNNQLVYALAVWNGGLYAGTYEEGEDRAGSVYRYEGGGEWTFCGSPDRCNSVTSLCVFEGDLYAAVSDYDAGGSQLERSKNVHPGGKVYRYTGGTDWIDCGRVGDAPYLFGLVEFDGSLYTTLIRSPNPTGVLDDLGLYRYEGGIDWEYCGHPGGRVCALAPYNGSLYATGYDGGEFGGVFRYEGEGNWTNCGVPGKTTQTYSFAFYEGKMYVGTWPEGKVYRYEGDKNWIDCGQLGEEKEVMGMAVYNGGMYAGTLPLAQVYRYRGERDWLLTGRLDWTPDVTYRRAWSMSVFDGKLFCGVLPSGHVHSLEVGKSVSYDRDLGTGWKHLAAIRDGGRLRLYVNGEAVAESSEFDPKDYDLDNEAPLKIGFGPHEYFKGNMSDLRIYDRSLTAERIEELYAESR